VQTADGKEAYTRDGGFQVDPNGVLRNRAGLAVQGDGGMITVPPDVQVSVGRDGTVSTVQENGARNSVSVIGRIKLVNPPETDLVRGEDGLFRTRNGLPAELDDQVRTAAGYIEGSNVNVSEQIVDMISLARQFEMQMKMLSTADSNDQAATKILAAQ
jgi:flagellar basal-body rod protein FlgF